MTNTNLHQDREQFSFYKKFNLKLSWLPFRIDPSAHYLHASVCEISRFQVLHSILLSQLTLQNRFRWDSYRARINEFRARLGGAELERPVLLEEQAMLDASVNEVMLFHGTGMPVIDALRNGGEINWGFAKNPRALAFVRSEMCFLLLILQGIGSYFSDAAAKALNYSQCR